MDLSIIIPVFNSENILENLVMRINKSLNNNNFKGQFEIILINDGSADASWEKIKILSNKFSNIKGLNLSENFGTCNATLKMESNKKSWFLMKKKIFITP